MSRLWARFAGLFGNRTLVGMDKAGNRYFARTDEIDGFRKEKRWVVFKGEQDPTSIPAHVYCLCASTIVVEWICWLNGQRRSAPTPEEMAELEARRERVRLNVALLKKEEEERKAREVATKKAGTTGKVAGPDLRSFIQQFPIASEGGKTEEAAVATNNRRIDKATEAEKKTLYQDRKEPPESSEPIGSGESFRPGTWQPPS